MPNDYYSKSGWPAQNSFGSSQIARDEMQLLEQAFDKLPDLSANAGAIVKVNNAGDGMDTMTISELATEIGGGNKSIKSASFTAEAGSVYFVNVASGAITITLPSGPAINDLPIRIIHVNGNIVNNPITVARNGSLIMGLAEDMTVNTNYATVELLYSNSTYGWRLGIT